MTAAWPIDAGEHFQPSALALDEGRLLTVSDHDDTDTKFGLGEGLAVSEQDVFVVLDNNELPRAAAPADRRALLFRFRRPPELTPTD